MTQYTCGFCKIFKDKFENILEHFKECKDNPNYLKEMTQEELIKCLVDLHKDVFDKAFAHMAVFGVVTSEDIERFVNESISRKDSGEV